jgi:hypothetical protein
MLEEFREGMIGTRTREAFMAGGDLENGSPQSPA